MLINILHRNLPDLRSDVLLDRGYPSPSLTVCFTFRLPGFKAEVDGLCEG
jgi:hypothetical protein